MRVLMAAWRAPRNHAVTVLLCAPLVGCLPQSGCDLGAERIERAVCILLSQPRHLSVTSWQADTGYKSTSLLQPHGPGSGSAEAQLLLKQLAGIGAQNPPAHPVS